LTEPDLGTSMEAVCPCAASQPGPADSTRAWHHLPFCDVLGGGSWHCCLSSQQMLLSTMKEQGQGNSAFVRSPGCDRRGHHNACGGDSGVGGQAHTYWNYLCFSEPEKCAISHPGDPNVLGLVLSFLRCARLGVSERT
jgi:hypothetical protein